MIVRQLKENRRLTYFDKLKGIAIFFVVLGHCLQTLMPDCYATSCYLHSNF